MTKRRGFTLIEVLIAMAIILVLAGIVYPLMAEGDTELSSEGYPNRIEPAWFTHGMPVDAWTKQPLMVQVVHGSKDATSPSNESFVIKPDGRPAGHTAWYNAANGAFCVKVPRVGTKDERLELFSRVNGVTPIAGHG
ncbi:MAG: prepilin-type N-terminal cleavage/methylation domain-containing protein [Planctomycetota bacterium]|jgi:prepilin-type N-terminal cleavage/methylation domain-containing protein